MYPIQYIHPWFNPDVTVSEDRIDSFFQNDENIIANKNFDIIFQIYYYDQWGDLKFHQMKINDNIENLNIYKFFEKNTFSKTNIKYSFDNEDDQKLFDFKDQYVDYTGANIVGGGLFKEINLINHEEYKMIPENSDIIFNLITSTPYCLHHRRHNPFYHRLKINFPGTLFIKYDTKLGRYEKRKLYDSSVENRNRISQFNRNVGICPIIFENDKYIVFSPYHVETQIWVYNKDSDEFSNISVHLSYIKVVDFSDDVLTIVGLYPANCRYYKINLQDKSIIKYNSFNLNSKDNVANLTDDDVDNLSGYRWRNVPRGYYVDDRTLIAFLSSDEEIDNYKTYLLIKITFTYDEDNEDDPISFSATKLGYVKGRNNGGFDSNYPIVTKIEYNNKKLLFIYYFDLIFELYDITDENDIQLIQHKSFNCYQPARLIKQLDTNSFLFVSNYQIIKVTVTDTDITFKEKKVVDPYTGLTYENFKEIDKQEFYFFEVRNNILYHYSRFVRKFIPTSYDLSNLLDVQIEWSEVEYTSVPFDTSATIKVEDFLNDTYVSKHLKLELVGGIFKDQDSNKIDDILIEDTGTTIDIQVTDPTTFRLYYEYLDS